MSQQILINEISPQNSYISTDKQTLNTFLTYVKNSDSLEINIKILTVILLFAITRNDLLLVQYCLDNGVNPTKECGWAFSMANIMGLDLNINTDNNTDNIYQQP